MKDYSGFAWRVLGYDIDDTYGLQQIIIAEVNHRKVFWGDLPDFVKQRARDKGLAPWMLTRPGAL